MKRAYEKPTIMRHMVGGISNKFGLALGPKSCEQIEGVAVSELLAKYGSPLFVFSEKKIQQKHQELMRAFSLRYPRVRHVWSYKTNYLRAICSAFHRQGSGAEVVSGMEYEMARRLGIDGHDIVFNGPLKPYPILKRALLEGAWVNLDGPDELGDVERISRETQTPLAVGIRVNLSLGAQMSWDRFGFNLESGAAMDAVRRAAASGIRIQGLHAHLGTFICDPELYRTAVKKMLEFYQIIRAEYGITLRYIDLGGGFASRNRLKGNYLSTADSAPSFDQYAEAICEPLQAAFEQGEAPMLLLETGRAMIDEAGSLLATVTNIKRLHTGKRALILDAGVNALFTSFWYDHELVPAVDRGRVLEDHVVFGPLCMQIDVVRDLVRLPPLERGDAVVIRPAGAYNNTQWMQFISLRPAIVMISDQGAVSMIRRAECLDDLQQAERLPEWFAE